MNMLTNIGEGQPVNSTTNQVSVINEEKKDKPDEKKDTKLSNAAKYMIGATALAAVIAVGIITHKKIKVNKLNKELDKQIETLAERLSSKNNLYPKWNEAVAKQHVDEALSLGTKKEQLKRLKEIDDVISKDRGLSARLYNYGEEETAKFIGSLPQDVLAAIEKGDRYTATKLYIDYCDSLFHKSETAGKTIAESVENVFGKDSIVKPHTYDLSKENDAIAMGVNGGGGFRTHVVTSDNKYADCLNHKTYREYTDALYPPGVKGEMPKDNPTVPIIQSGEFNGRKFVSVSYQDAGYCYSDPNVGNGFTLYSQKGGDYTPAQKDLLKLADKLTSDDTKLLWEIPHGLKSNFDAILSLVQTLASRVA